MPDMKREAFYYGPRNNYHTLRIETDGCTVNIRVGLFDADGRQITRVDVVPDGEDRGGDGDGRIWRITPGDDPGVTRVVRDPENEQKES
jgi:hypothetical protein